MIIHVYDRLTSRYVRVDGIADADTCRRIAFHIVFSRSVKDFQELMTSTSTLEVIYCGEETAKILSRI